MMKKLISWVFPGVVLILARFLLKRRELIKDDLPTLDLPAKAICGLLSVGNCTAAAALMTNSAESIFMPLNSKMYRVKKEIKYYYSNLIPIRVDFP